jgi:hypothetical protein
MNSQMELSFAEAIASHREIRRQSRLSRARWWFAQMRQVVDRALDRGPRRPGRPEQTYFSLRRNS